jgi:hypothetical protein
MFTIVESSKGFTFNVAINQILPEFLNLLSSTLDEYAHLLSLNLLHVLQLVLVCSDSLKRASTVQLNKLVDILIGYAESFPKDVKLVEDGLNVGFSPRFLVFKL